MIQKRQYINVCLILLFCIGSVSSTTTSQLAGDMLPERLSDQAFWDMTEAISEPNGYFRSDNLLSNEMRMQYVIPNLILRTQPRGAYLGVGPEQNFTYIAALRPRIAFIIDIRRGNLHTHLMYKALFELAPDRADEATNRPGFWIDRAGDIPGIRKSAARGRSRLRQKSKSGQGIAARQA
jgi:hypothetical protein